MALTDEPIGGILDRLATNGGSLNQTMGKLLEAVAGLAPFPGGTGSFICSAASTTVVTTALAKTNSFIATFPTNAAAATLMAGAASLYLSTRTTGSFTMATASGGSAAGTETFIYMIINPSA